MQTVLGIQGIVRLLQYRESRLLRDITVRNKIVFKGKEDLLNQFFRGVATWTNFYVGLVKGDWDQFTENDPNLATLGTKEFTTYTEGARRQLTFAAADTTTDANYIFVQNTSANYATFTVGPAVVNQVLDGIFIASTASYGAPARIWCSAAFGNNDSSPAAVTVNTADVLRVQYTVRIPKA